MSHAGLTCSKNWLSYSKWMCMMIIDNLHRWKSSHYQLWPDTIRHCLYRCLQFQAGWAKIQRPLHPGLSQLCPSRMDHHCFPLPWPSPMTLNWRNRCIPSPLTSFQRPAIRLKSDRTCGTGLSTPHCNHHKQRASHLQYLNLSIYIFHKRYQLSL